MLRIAINLAILIILFAGCTKSSGEQEINNINLISVKLDGAPVVSGVENISINPTLRLTFSQSINTTSFEESLRITPTAAVEIVSMDYLNNSSVVKVVLELEYDTNYSVNLEGAIGKNGETLSTAFALNFNTQLDETTYSKPPCLNATDCEQSLLITHGSGQGIFDFYSNYDIYEDNAYWQNLEKAIIVIHGASVNADDYFNYLTSTLEDLDISDKTILISPHFKNNEETEGDLYWNSLSYRDGKPSNGPTTISSFEVLDILIERLGDRDHFPVLNEIIVTGQSSGGRFVHTYAAGNRSEAAHTSIHFEYIVSESQYFFYPTGERIDEQTNNLYTPSNCNGLNFWPFGYEFVPEYVNVLDKETFVTHFINRNITYLLGNGTGSDSSLNTTACEAVLSGSSRYNRGENILSYMNLKYGSSHNHKKVIAQGISHNGFQIYTSTEFKSLLTQLLND